MCINASFDKLNNFQWGVIIIFASFSPYLILFIPIGMLFYGIFPDGDKGDFLINL
jgi:hypothetical protein